MNLTILAIGQLKRSPERDLTDLYIDRALKTGRGIGFRAVKEVQVDAGPNARAEAARVLERVPSGAKLLALDERGEDMTSEAFANMLGQWRDQGISETVFAIGGAEGFDPSVRDAAQKTLRFGKATWPHKLVRAMIAEQVYRATTLLAGLPYHKV